MRRLGYGANGGCGSMSTTVKRLPFDSGMKRSSSDGVPPIPITGNGSVHLRVWVKVTTANQLSVPVRFNLVRSGGHAELGIQLSTKPAMVGDCPRTDAVGSLRS